MSKVVVKTETVVVALELTLTVAEGEALVEYLDLMDKGAREFRVANPSLYYIQSSIEEALVVDPPDEDDLA